MEMNSPLVSAIMLTKNRFNLLKLAIENFVNQTYEYKELIIVNNGNIWYKYKVDKYINTQNVSIKHIKTNPASIGKLRNLGVKSASGKYCITFDDDDYHAPMRIEKQIDACLKSNGDGTVLKNFVAVFGKDRYQCSFRKGLEGTLLFKKPDQDQMIKYLEISKGEDTQFIEQLKESKYDIVVLDEFHEMYEYRFHGKNTVSEEHFQKIVTKCIKT